jgi:hypothetical protein
MSYSNDKKGKRAVQFEMEWVRMMNEIEIIMIEDDDDEEEQLGRTKVLIFEGFLCASKM